MSRRWYRHGGNMVFLGWDRNLGRFLLTVADLCTRCGGYGEEPTSDNFCFECGGEGVRVGSNSAANADDTRCARYVVDQYRLAE